MPSVTLRLSVWLPLETPMVFQLTVAVFVPCATLPLAIVVALSCLSTYCQEPDGLPTVMVTGTLPFTVEPLAGLVIAALKGGGAMPFENVMDTLAVAVWPAVSFTVTLRLWGPSGKFVGSQASETVSAMNVRW